MRHPMVDPNERLTMVDPNEALRKIGPERLSMIDPNQRSTMTGPKTIDQYRKLIGPNKGLTRIRPTERPTERGSMIYPEEGLTQLDPNKRCSMRDGKVPHEGKAPREHFSDYPELCLPENGKAYV